ncbi:hypothetical protein NM688_g463 [Phlebia brevispora]|uniref:Uncharacterized protein n=1 Tax=Phlebia brevispora TaxID=194682 RepID=A0ACC1TED9_9APHY|nr:hypothetical protein NM688_g463 [Phlebia brevispora]
MPERLADRPPHTFHPGQRIYKCNCLQYCILPGEDPKLVCESIFWQHMDFRAEEDKYAVSIVQRDGSYRLVKISRRRRDPNKLSADSVRRRKRGEPAGSAGPRPYPAPHRPSSAALQNRECAMHQNDASGAFDPLQRASPRASPAPSRGSSPQIPDLQNDQDASRQNDASGGRQLDSQTPEVPPLPKPYEPRDDPTPSEPSHTSNASHMQLRIEEIPDEDEYDEQAESVRPGPSADVMADEEWETDIPAAQLEDLRIAQEFIRLMQDATLAADKLDPQVLYRLRNPLTEELDLSCPILRMSLEVYLLDNITIDTYNGVRGTVQRNLNVTMLSYDQVKRRCAEISEVCPVYHDMCVDTCASFTGPFAALDKCSICNKDRFELRYPCTSARRCKKFPCRQFLTIPCGPQLQALSRTPEGAAAMSYRERCTARLMAELSDLDWKIPVLKDYLFGQEYVEAVRCGEITNNDIVLLISMDGAQLYTHKLSDCWIYIWVILEHSPEV